MLKVFLFYFWSSFKFRIFEAFLVNFLELYLIPHHRRLQILFVHLRQQEQAEEMAAEELPNHESLYVAFYEQNSIVAMKEIFIEQYIFAAGNYNIG